MTNTKVNMLASDELTPLCPRHVLQLLHVSRVPGKAPGLALAVVDLLEPLIDLRLTSVSGFSCSRCSRDMLGISSLSFVTSWSVI